MAETEHECDIDHIIEQLVIVKGSRPGRQVNLLVEEIRWLCNKSKDIFMAQPVLLELEAPIKICGGELYFSSLMTIYRIIYLNEFDSSITLLFMCTLFMCTHNFAKKDIAVFSVLHNINS